MSEYIINSEDYALGMATIPYLREKIVRCRDCKYHEPMVVLYLDKPLSVCTAEWCEGAEGDNPLVKPNGFCAWGERKEQ